MIYTIRFSNGDRESSYDSYAEAKEAILDRWPLAAIGHDGDLEHSGERTLFWETEDDSLDDDGARALGSIVIRR